MKSHPLKTLYYPDIPTGLLEAYEHGVLEVLELVRLNLPYNF